MQFKVCVLGIWVIDMLSWLGLSLGNYIPSVKHFACHLGDVRAKSGKFDPHRDNPLTKGIATWRRVGKGPP